MREPRPREVKRLARGHPADGGAGIRTHILPTPRPRLSPLPEAASRVRVQKRGKEVTTSSLFLPSGPQRVRATGPRFSAVEESGPEPPEAASRPGPGAPETASGPGPASRAMYRPGEAAAAAAAGARRRPAAPPGPRVRTVEVARGRGGYGFTLAGQGPCVLSRVVPGGPADHVGLRPGDRVLGVNEINVRKASHEDVVKLVGKCSGLLRLVVGEGRAPPPGSGSSDEEAGPADGPGRPKPRLDSRALGIDRAERVVEDLRAGGIFGLLFDRPEPRARAGPERRSLSESAAARADRGPEPVVASRSFPEAGPAADGEDGDGDEEAAVFGPEAARLDAGILNVAMVVGYLGSIELPSTGSNVEHDSLQAIRGCMRRLRAEQRVHSLVLLRVLHDRVQLCADRPGPAVAAYPADKLAFSAVCPDDRRFFGLVTVQPGDGGAGPAAGPRDDPGDLRTSCHVFMVDPDLFAHQVHRGIARRFGFRCTADPDTDGCLEFPPSSLPVLQFVSVLYRDMGELIEGVRARALPRGDAEAPHHNNSTSSDSGIGNFHPEDKGNRVLVVDLGGPPGKHPPPPAAAGGPRETEPPPRRSPLGPAGPGPLAGPRRPPGRGLRDWPPGPASDQESYTDSTDGWSSVNCGTLPPPMSKIPADRYRLDGGGLAAPQLGGPKHQWPRRAFAGQNLFGPHRHVRKAKDDKKVAKPGSGPGLSQPAQRSAARRSFGRSKRFSVTRSLDDLESATVSDGELNSSDLKDRVSTNSLSSNASLPSVQSCRRLRERRVASWAVSFERLLQDPAGVRYFSDFLRKEFSEENILFWQACEYFNHVPAHDKKELSYRAREIFSKFLCSKATTPVNIDSQAQLADDILNAPHPDMFKEQQLQIFNLMKFDSYTRFLKSQLYQECILAEVEGHSLPDSHQVPSSPASKHSINSDRSSVSTPKKLSGKSKSGRSLNEESGEEDSEKRRKGTFFSWSRNKSTGRSQKKKDRGEHHSDSPHPNGGLYRRESQGSMSSAASLELSETYRLSVSEKEKSSKHCCIHLPDGSSSMVAVKAGFSIKEILSGLCEKHGINVAAVDLFLVGGDKPLVLHQDSSILESRDLRLEKRTLFRLDLVPINRSVGLKAKPTKPVTEVLRPVVAKYGLNLSDLVVRLSGEKEPLDLGVPISNLDGQRVILDEKDSSRGKAFTDKQKGASAKQNIAGISSSRNLSSTGEERTLGKSNSIKIKGENGKNAREPRLSKREESIAKIGKKKYQKINLDEAEEFFELISKAQSNRADDQRGLLRKEDLVLPDFLRLPPEPSSSTPAAPKGLGRGAGKGGGKSKTAQPNGKADAAQSCGENSLKNAGPSEGRPRPGPAALHASRQKPSALPFVAPLSPIPHAQEGPSQVWRRQSRELPPEGIQTIDDDNVADLTLVGEGDINSPNSTLLPPPPSPPADAGKLAQANYSPPTPLTDKQGKSAAYQRSNSDCS
uniref:Regulator of G protein signaling 12 n=1 Tax=Ornithorhynchus anatinus TaxID=9258 RepID=A0A6I8NAJ9_ORNAN